MNKLLPIAWLGGKAKLAMRIASRLPEHSTYVEPFGGNPAVLFAKPPAGVEVYNGIDSALTGLFEVLGDDTLYPQLQQGCDDTAYSRAEFELAQEACSDPVEAARRFIVRRRQSHIGLGRQRKSCPNGAQDGISSAERRWQASIERLPEIHRRLRQVRIERDDWARVIERYDSPRTLFYLAPPDTFPDGGDRHAPDKTGPYRLASRLLQIRGMAILTGQRHEAYRILEDAGWQRVDYDVPAYLSPRRQPRQESLWFSPAAQRAPQTDLAPGLRMRQGAYQTHRLRTGSTEARVRNAIGELRSLGKRVTFSAVGQVLEMSREHLSRRYRHLFDRA